MYAVFGATGNTGRVVAEQLLARGKQVRAIVRDPSKAEALRRSGAQLVAADLSDPGSLNAALRGVTSAYVVQPPNVERDDMVLAARAQADNLASAIAQAELQHVVHLSSLGAQHASGTGPIVGLHYSEQRLRSATRALSSLRAPYFIENWGAALGTLAQGQLVSMLPLELKIPMIATDDIGQIAASVLLEGAAGHQVIELEGPQNYSARDIAQTLSSLAQRPITPVEVPQPAIAEAFRGVGFGARNAEIYAEMYAAIASGRAAAEGTHRKLRGRVSSEQALARLLAPVRNLQAAQ
jgi:uncharacterized protein YbjT (DUF2867 family)